MTGPFNVFPNVQRLLVVALEALVPSPEHTGIETPDDLTDPAAGRMPFIRVLKGGGSRDHLNDEAIVDIDVFASTYTQAEALAEKVSAYLCGPPPPVAQFDRVDCDNPPQEFPWEDDGSATPVRRFGASYTVVTRRRRWLD